MTHTAKRIRAGEYLYRGVVVEHIIGFVGRSYDNYWTAEIGLPRDTFRDMKKEVDRILDRESA